MMTEDRRIVIDRNWNFDSTLPVYHTQLLYRKCNGQWCIEKERRRVERRVESSKADLTSR
jgi:hypothetical protein